MQLSLSDLTTLGVAAFIIVVLVMGAIMAIRERNIGKLTDALVRVLDDQRVRTEGERRYAESSLSVQDFLSLVHSGVVVIGGMNLPVIDKAVDKLDEFLKDIEDGEEGDEDDPVDPHTADTNLMDPLVK